MIDELEPIIKLPSRTLFCNPDDESWIKRNILANDIRLITSRYINHESYIATKDIKIEVKLQFGMDFADFENNEMTVMAYHTFS